MTGYNRAPIHAARAALSTRYTADRWHNKVKSLMEEVSATLTSAQTVQDKLDNLVRYTEPNCFLLIRACCLEIIVTVHRKLNTIPNLKMPNYK